MDVTAVIDVGSNSVRLGVFRAGKAEYKTLITSRLGEGVTCGNLNENAVNRTINAIAELKDHAFSLGAGELYAFATEAVRRAENGADFVKKTLVKTGVCIYIASGEEEASLAVEGALGGKETAERAMACVGEGKGEYNLVFNNCEHFANWCKYGEKSSSQVRTAVAATAVAVGVGAIITAVATALSSDKSDRD